MIANDLILLLSCGIFNSHKARQFARDENARAQDQQSHGHKYKYQKYLLMNDPRDQIDQRENKTQCENEKPYIFV